MLSWFKPYPCQNHRIRSRENFEDQPISFCTPRRKVVQHVKVTFGCLCLELQRNEWSAPLNVYSTHLYQRMFQTSLTTPKENESSSQGYSQIRTTKAARCRIHLPYLRQSVGLSFGVGSKEKWEVEDLCWLQRVRQSHKEESFPTKC